MRVPGGIVKLDAQDFPDSKEDDGWLSPEGWVVNNPQDSGPAWRWTAERWLPPVDTQTIPTIGDRLEEKGVTWKWYAQYQSIMPGVGASDELNGIGGSREEYVQRALEMLRNTATFDVSGHPALNVPCGMPNGLPIGMMLIGKHYDEATVLRAAKAFEGIGDWKTM